MTPEPLYRKGQGQELPGFLRLDHPEAVRGTRLLRTITDDPNLLVVWDPRPGRDVFMVWGNSAEFGGRCPIMDCQDDTGRPFRGTVPWELIGWTMRQMREGALSADLVRQENERREAARVQALRDKESDAVDFYAKAIQGEAAGYGRHSAEDVADAYNRQVKGEKPGPKGQIISLPG